ncbi:50S ribosomal protein L29 [Actomonas aquatica]|uniref:Large ribosomal subunit protein uL29 n=1 Tax=Actomonas aquatica TaxID=2866162 RepID=A0ABZ1CDC3_9BACT|nr:50S ribosomal protein L29 [Opitutus sp. WL0086]WRQ89665.1 50S ribosomal protein L29 [Opitutus sp. WL0086]
MKAKDIRELAPTEIETKLRETREALLDLRLKKNAGLVEKPHQLRSLRKEIARLETILNEKQTAAA